MGTTSETSTIYDAEEKIWKRWSLESNAVTGRRELYLQTSANGNEWQRIEQPVFQANAADSASWDHSAIASPVVLLNPDGDQARRFMLWYSGSNSERPVTDTASGAPSTSLGLAFSADGKNFFRLPADESPYLKEGLVLTADRAFPRAMGIAGGSLGEPKVSLSDGMYTLSFYRVGTDQEGTVKVAGLGAAISADGVNWTLDASPPVTVEIVGKTTTTPALVQRLRQLVDAYSECPM
jgi:hypothetical protein